MLKNFHKIATAYAIAMALVFAPLMSAKAYTVDPNVFAGTKVIAARECGNGTQAICYLRVTFNFNDANIGTGVQFATLPKNAYISAIDVYVTTAFNAAGNNFLSVGVTSAGVEFVATTGGATVTATLPTPGVYHLTAAAGLGLAATSVAGSQTMVNGGVPVFLKYTQTSTAATTGKATMVIMFAMDNDE